MWVDQLQLTTHTLSNQSVTNSQVTKSLSKCWCISRAFICMRNACDFFRLTILRLTLTETERYMCYPLPWDFEVGPHTLLIINHFPAKQKQSEVVGQIAQEMHSRVDSLNYVCVDICTLPDSTTWLYIFLFLYLLSPMCWSLSNTSSL